MFVTYCIADLPRNTFPTCYTMGVQDFVHQNPRDVHRIVTTNLGGALLCTHAALRLMGRQPTGGHIFNVDGAGAGGAPTPKYAAYGTTKAGIAQLHRSMQAEAIVATRAFGNPVAVHTLSPGMVLTDLLLDGTTQANKAAFNILCEHPETVASFLVPRARAVVVQGRRGAYIRYLTPIRILAKVLTAPLLRHRFFGPDGETKYPPEAERLAAAAALRAAGAAVTGRAPVAAGLVYSVALVAVVLVVLADPALAHHR
jgi:chlorophyll(ide) b reductase